MHSQSIFHSGRCVGNVPTSNHCFWTFVASKSRASRIRSLIDVAQFMMALPRILVTSTVSNVEALLIIAHLYHNCSDRNAAWTLIGCATRIAVARSLQRSELTQTFQLVEREIWKRLWCTLYTGLEQLRTTSWQILISPVD